MDGHAGAAQFGSDPAFADERIHLFDAFQAFVDAAIENRQESKVLRKWG